MSDLINALAGLITLGIFVFIIVSVVKVFIKAGKPAWAPFVPIYNTLVLIEIAKKPWWYLLLMLIPLVNFVIVIMVLHGVSKAFGKGALFTIFGLVLFPYVGFPMLAFGDSTYTK